MRYPCVIGTEKLEEAVVMWHHARHKRLVAVERECGPSVGGDVYHCLSKLPPHFFVRRQVAILSQGQKYVEGILHRSDHPVPQ